MKKPLFIGILFVLALSVVLIFGRPDQIFLSNPSQDEEIRKSIILSESRDNIILLSFNFGAETKNFEIETNGAETLLGLIQKTNLKLETENFPPIGKMIVSINGFKNGEDGKYWQFWINGKYAQIGASAYKPKPGDQIEWRFTNNKPE